MHNILPEKLTSLLGKLFFSFSMILLNLYLMYYLSSMYVNGLGNKIWRLLLNVLCFFVVILTVIYSYIVFQDFNENSKIYDIYPICY